MDGSIWVLLVAAILFATSLLLHRCVDGHLSVARLPLTWFYASWLFGLLLLTLPLFRYIEKFSIETGAYFIGVLFSYTVGSVAAAFWNRRPKVLNATVADETKQQPLSREFLLGLLVMGVTGTSLLLINTLLGGGLSLADRLDSTNLGAIREAHVASAANRIGVLYGPSTIMSSIGGLGIAIAFYLRGSRDPMLASGWLYRLAQLALAINVIIGVIGFGSRMFSLFAILFGFLGFVEGRWSIGERLIIKRLTTKGFAVICVSVVLTTGLLWSSATVFLEKRVNALDPQSLLYRTHRANFSPLVYSLTRTDQASQYFMFSLSYFSTPIPTLVYYLDLPDSRQPGPFFGQYNFPPVARWLRRLTFSEDPIFWEKARQDIFKPLGDIQFGTNVWASMVRDVIADFGKAGTLFFIASLAFFSQRNFDLQRFSPSSRRAGLMVYLRILLAFSGLISVLFLPHIHWPLYLAVILMLIGGPKAIRSKSAAVVRKGPSSATA